MKSVFKIFIFELITEYFYLVILTYHLLFYLFKLFINRFLSIIFKKIMIFYFFDNLLALFIIQDLLILRRYILSGYQHILLPYSVK